MRDANPVGPGNAFAPIIDGPTSARWPSGRWQPPAPREKARARREALAHPQASRNQHTAAGYSNFEDRSAAIAFSACRVLMPPNSRINC
jgi:hypothetical protein